MRTRPVAALAALTLTVGGLVAAPLITAPATAASGGSLVYVKGHNIWISTPDGKRQHRVTKDGTAGLPYSTPSMSDSGIIAAAKGHDIVRMRQNGQVLNRFNPPPLISSVSYPTDGVPSTVAISPDGSKIAWSVTNWQAPVGWSSGYRSVTGYTTSTGYKKIGVSTYYNRPSWVSNTRTLQGGGYGSHVMIHDINSAPVHWFDGGDVHDSGIDLGDSVLSRDGRFLAAIRGYDSSTQVNWYTVNGNARTGAPPAAPAPKCETNEAAGFQDPTLSSDSNALAWQEPDGIWVKTGLTNCGSPQPRRLIAGASEPFWSAAALNPPPAVKAPVAAKVLKLKKKPKVSGKAKVGRTVKVTAGTWSPKPTKVTYRWYRGSKPIKGKVGAKRAYKLKKADRGKKVRVKIVVKRGGYKTRATWSTWSPKVKR